MLGGAGLGLLEVRAAAAAARRRLVGRASADPQAPRGPAAAPNRITPSIKFLPAQYPHAARYRTLDGIPPCTDPTRHGIAPPARGCAVVVARTNPPIAQWRRRLPTSCGRCARGCADGGRGTSSVRRSTSASGSTTQARQPPPMRRLKSMGSADRPRGATGRDPLERRVRAAPSCPQRWSEYAESTRRKTG